MGSFSSKILKSNCTDGMDKKDRSKDRIDITDPRSPTGEIIRTPITFEKEKLQNGDSSNSKIGYGRGPLLHKRILKNLKLDPRSPSDNINRTPIFLNATPVPKSTQTCNPPESPLSVYSNNFSGTDSYVDIVSPGEPSVNVSGFERSNGLNNDLDLASFLEDVSNGNEEADETIEKEESKSSDTPLKVSSNPSTLEARKLLNEILSSKEFERELIRESKKEGRKSENRKTLSVHCDNSNIIASDRKKDKIKYRTPLSNITLSSNSPYQANRSKKPYDRHKLASEAGLENSITQIAEWDKDKTVII